MARPLPRWLFKKYSQLWVANKNKNIKIEEIKTFFDNQAHATAMSNMVECGWVKRVSLGNYKLNSPEKMVEVIAHGK